MKRKPQAAPQPEVSPETVDEAKRLAQAGKDDDPDQAGPMARCEVCGGDATPNPTEQLCWVCRRLKISAWRDVEQQMPAQE